MVRVEVDVDARDGDGGHGFTPVPWQGGDSGEGVTKPKALPTHSSLFGVPRFTTPQSPESSSLVG